MAKKDTRNPLAVLSFVDSHGATVVVADGSARDYAGVKSEQLRAITQLLVLEATGVVELPHSLHEIFSLTANALAHDMERMVGLIVEDCARLAASASAQEAA
jgi:hypothetical protein